MKQHCAASGIKTDKFKFLKKIDKFSQIRMCWFVVLICINSIFQVFKLKYVLSIIFFFISKLSLLLSYYLIYSMFEH